MYYRSGIQGGVFIISCFLIYFSRASRFSTILTKRGAPLINYYLITKPGIILGNLITVLAGFFLASRGIIDFSLFFATLIGISLIIASACVFNNVIDRNRDKKMERTQRRALVTGAISTSQAIVFATILGLAGGSILLFYTNLLTTFIAGIGFFTYVCIYSIWKGHTLYGTAIGSIAGAVPPLVGYCAASNRFDMGALILFLMLIFWQMPHFFAIALLHFKDYVKADIPLLPIKKGVHITKIRMVLYILGFMLTTGMLTAFNYTGYTYLAVTSLVGLIWLLLSLKGFARSDNQAWGKQMFHFSLVTITVTCCMVFIDTL